MVDGPSRLHRQDIIPSVGAIVPSERTGRRDRVQEEEERERKERKKKEQEQPPQEGTGHRVDILA